MDEYYLFTGEDSLPAAIAYALGIDKLSFELIPDLKDAIAVPFDLTLRAGHLKNDRLVHSDDFSDIGNIWTDYMPNEFTWLLMSSKMRKVIDSQLSGEESIDWLTCGIGHAGEVVTYNVLRFDKPLDVLNIEETTFVKGTDHIIKPVFAQKKIRNYKVFNKPSFGDNWRIPPAVYIATSVKQAIEKAGLTGVAFSRAKVV
ncbi:hypothetical protein WBG78_01485 [Chryseolinea sp. T2]|uniref:hypothetical protein n=1 Tax=Chryseolinea sp. T2 TaxID=3129255 RepID=UPI003076B539